MLVTGATGGLGRVLVQRLVDAGCEVRATGRRAEIGAEIAHGGAEFVRRDLATDPLEPLTEGISTIFHLAALSSPWGPRTAFETANVIATRRLLNAARSSGCSTFVYASTPSIYTRPSDQLNLTETLPPPLHFANHYARTKFVAEGEVLSSVKDDFHPVALRPRAILGPYDTALLPRLLRAADKGILPLPAGGTALIEPTDARDTADAFIAAARTSERNAGRVFNISGGVGLPVRTLAEKVFELFGKQVRIVSVPRRFARFAGRALETAAKLLPGQPEPPLTVYSATVLGWSQTFDLTAPRQSLDWSPTHHPLASVEWALENMRHA